VADDAGQGGLAQARRAGEQEVVHGLASAAGRLEHHAEPLLELGLAHELVEAPRPQPGLLAELLGIGLGLEQLLPHGTTSGVAPARRWSAARSRRAASPSSGRSRRTSRISSSS